MPKEKRSIVSFEIEADLKGKFADYCKGEKYTTTSHELRQYIVRTLKENNKL